MSALPRPELSPGPARELNDALHELHHRAGWPSLRALARDAGVSHTTVSHVFSSPKLSSWGTVELLVEAMGGSTADFHQLWLAASAPDGEASPAAPAIAGRKAELAAVRRHLQNGSGLLLVTGEAGIGKTKLVTTAASSVAADCFVATGSCLPLSTDAPMLPMADVLRAAYEVDQGQWVKEALSECPNYVKSSIARLVPDIAPDAPSDPEDEARQRLLTAVGTVLQALGSVRRTGVLLEDLHWADGATLDALARLLTRDPGVPLLCTWRTEDEQTASASIEWLSRTRRMPNVTELELGSLNREESAEQLALLDGCEPDPDLVERIYARSQGLPLFTEQLAAHAENDEALPSLLVDVLGQRLAGISEPARSAARILAVADRPLPEVQLVRAAGLPRDALAAAMHELQDHRLLATTTWSTDVRLRHPLLAEAIRQRLVAGEREDVHRRVATVLADTREPVAAEIALHWREADDPEQELVWQVRAAKTAHALLDPAQEAQHWLRVRALWPDSATTDAVPDLTRARVGLDAAKALILVAGRVAEASELLDDMVSWLPEMSVPEEGDLFKAKAWMHSVFHEADGGTLDLIDRSIEVWRRIPPSAGLAGSLGAKGLHLGFGGRHTEGIEALRESLDVAEGLGDPDLVFWALAVLAWNEAFAGDLGSALRTLASARTSVTECSWETVIWVAEMHTDLLLFHERPVDEIEEAARDAMRIIRTEGIETLHARFVRLNLCLAMVRAGQLARAAALIAPVTDGPVFSDNALPHVVRMHVDVLLGREADADAQLQELESVQINDPLEAAMLAEVAATADVWRGRPERAFERMTSALDRVVEPSDSEFTGSMLVLAATAAADASADGRWADRLGSLADLRRRAARDPLAIDAAPGARHAQRATWNAEIARLQGKQSVPGWVSAAKEWDKLTRPHDAAYCRWRGAQVALATGQAGLAQKLLRRAATDAREHVPLLTAIRATTP